MAFYDTLRLPIDVERGSEGGHRFRNRIQELPSGREQRSPRWSQVRGRWDVGYGLIRKSEDTYIQVRNLHWAVNGTLHGWLFHAWDDFHLPDNFSTDVTAFQSIGTGDGIKAVFDIFKRYEPNNFITGSPSGIFFDRRIFKPIISTLTIRWDTTPKVEGVDYTINNLGQIDWTIGGLPASEDINIQCEFLIGVRFLAEDFDTVMRTALAGERPELLIRELKLAP